MPVGDKRGRGYELGTTVVQIQIVVRALRSEQHLNTGQVQCPNRSATRDVHL